jgi:hypothetical protein
LVETLTAEHGELTFGNVEPAAVFWRVVHLELGGQASCFVWCKGFIEGSRCVGVQVVTYKQKFGCIGVHLISQVSKEQGAIEGGSAFCGLRYDDPSQRLDREEDVGCSATHVLVVLPGDFAWLC